MIADSAGLVSAAPVILLAVVLVFLVRMSCALRDEAVMVGLSSYR